MRVPVTSTDCFTFNCGEGSLRRSTLRRRLNAGNRSAVRSELMKWVYSGGKKLPGLVRRRQAEGALFANGKYN
jgi:lysozyme